jgi:hypothetical protein
MSDQGNTFNVLDYFGPPPLSMTYDGAFQLAIAAATASGGIVLMPPGTYDITNDINPVSDITLSGYGATLVFTDSGPAASVFSYSSISAPLINLTIEGFTIDLATHVVPGGAIAFGHPYLQDILLRDIHVMCSSAGANAAVSIGFVDDSSFPDNHSQRVHVDHCTFSNGSTGGTETLRLVSCDESSVSNCYFDNISTVIDSNHFSQCVGIYGYCNGIAVRGNIFRACNGSIMVAQGQNVVVENNIMRNGERADDLNWDIALRNCQNVQVLSNSLQGKNNSKAIVLFDYGGPTFDSHPSQFPNSADLVIGSNLIIGYTYGIVGHVAMSGSPPVTANQSNVVITNNLFIGNNNKITLPSTVSPAYTHDNP